MFSFTTWRTAFRLSLLIKPQLGLDWANSSRCVRWHPYSVYQRIFTRWLRAGAQWSVETSEYRCQSKRHLNTILSRRHLSNCNSFNQLFTTEILLTVTILQVSQPIVQAIVLPKIHSPECLDVVGEAIAASRKGYDGPPIQIIPSIESARGMFNIGSVAAWKSKHGIQAGVLSALCVR